jgi:putative addiction module component (TIGR02574 family)
MSTPPSIADLLELTPSERVLLAQDLWDSVAACPESIKLTKAQRNELELRLAEDRKDPSAALPWDTVRSRIRRAIRNRAR